MSTVSRQKVLVTGGGRGLGAAIVRALAGAGFAVDFTYRSAEAEAQALIAEISADLPDADLNARAVDLADRAAVEALAEELEAGDTYFGFCHNAGASYDTLAAMVDQDKAEAVMQVNHFAFVRIARAMVRPMTRAKAGRIVAIGSVAALQANRAMWLMLPPRPPCWPMCGVWRWRAPARRDGQLHRPGFIDTAMLAKFADHKARLEGQIPDGRFAQPDDVAQVGPFSSRPARAISPAAVIPVDGGLSAALAAHR